MKVILAIIGLAVALPVLARPGPEIPLEECFKKKRSTLSKRSCAIGSKSFNNDLLFFSLYNLRRSFIACVNQLSKVIGKCTPAATALGKGNLRFLCRTYSK